MKVQIPKSSGLFEVDLDSKSSKFLEEQRMWEDSPLITRSGNLDKAFQDDKRNLTKFDQFSEKEEEMSGMKVLLRKSLTKKSASDPFDIDSSDFKSEFKTLNVGSPKKGMILNASENDEQYLQGSHTRIGTEDQVAPDQEDSEDSHERDNLDELFGFDLGSSSKEANDSQESFELVSDSVKKEPKLKSMKGLRSNLELKTPNLNSFSGPLPKFLEGGSVKGERVLKKTSKPFLPKLSTVADDIRVPRQAPSFGEKAMGSNFEIDPKKIMSDSRTTIYIRHIPNKYTKEMMLATIDKTFKGAYDFFYLPIDFMSGSNVGYAFINFIDLNYLQDFYSVFHGQKWAYFNSEKICELRYARIQGKVQCEEHFEHSLLMSQPIQNYKPFLREKERKKSFAPPKK